EGDVAVAAHQKPPFPGVSGILHEQQNQRDDGGQGLHEEDLAVHRGGAKHARHDHAAQEKNLDVMSGGAQQQAPDQSGDQETVVQTLVGGQRLGGGGEIGFQAKSLAPQRFVPENHLEHHEIQVQHGDQSGQNVGGGGNHGGSL